MLNKIASALAALTFLIHFIVGGQDALAPMMSAELAPNAQGAMHACWHIVSVMLAWSVIVFYNGGKAAFHFGLIWIFSTVVFVYVGLSQAGLAGVTTNPQWAILFPTGIVAMLSVRHEMQQSNSQPNNPSAATKPRQ